MLRQRDHCLPNHGPKSTASIMCIQSYFIQARGKSPEYTPLSKKNKFWTLLSNIWDLSLSLVSVYLSMLSLCHSSWGPWVVLNPLVWHSLWHGVSPSPWSVGATVFFQKTFPLCPLAASSSSFQAQSKWWAFLDEGFFSFPDIYIATGPGWVTKTPMFILMLHNDKLQNMWIQEVLLLWQLQRNLGSSLPELGKVCFSKTSETQRVET